MSFTVSDRELCLSVLGMSPRLLRMLIEDVRADRGGRAEVVRELYRWSEETAAGEVGWTLERETYCREYRSQCEWQLATALEQGDEADLERVYRLATSIDEQAKRWPQAARRGEEQLHDMQWKALAGLNRQRGLELDPVGYDD